MAEKYDIQIKSMCFSYECKNKKLLTPTKIKVRLKNFVVEKTYICPECGEYLTGTFFNSDRVIAKIMNKIDIFLNK